MNKTTIPFIALIIVILVSIVAGYISGILTYRDYKEKTAILERQAEIDIEKIGYIENNLKELYLALDENKIERTKVLSRLDLIKEDIKDWKIGYASAVSELKKDIENLKVDRLTRAVEKLQDELRNFKMKVQDMDLKIDEVKEKALGGNRDAIDLGKISVKK